MSFVLDSSITLAWLYIDELTPATFRLSEMVGEKGAWVPSIWRLEVANSLQTSVRQRRIDAAFRDKSLQDLLTLNIQTDSDTVTFAWSTTLALAERHNLTTYDACYLELAQRKGMPLATLDKDLRAAGRKLSISLL